MTRISDKNIVTQVSVGSPKSSFGNFPKTDFDKLIEDKGYEVIYEKALKCPCKSRNSDHQSNCKNCGGTGWIFVNPIKTKMVVQSMSLNPKYQSWGVMGAEISSVTARDIDKLSYMDRVTVLNAISEHSEVLYFNWFDPEVLYTYSTYPILEVYYVGLFEGTNKPLRKLTRGAEYTITDENKIIITDERILASDLGKDNSIVIRYSHNPKYHIIEMVRDSISSPVKKGMFETIEQLPIHARAKRADLIKDVENYNGNRLFDNSWIKSDCDLKFGKEVGDVD